MTTAQFVGVVCVVGFAAMVQSISGFGFSLVVVPLMSTFLAPQTAVVIASLIGLSSSTVIAWRERGHADAKVARRLMLAATAGMPAGLVVFVTVPADGLRVLLGTVVLVAAWVLARGFTLDHSSVRDEWLLGAVSGVLNTSVSTNGPPLVFLLAARGYLPAVFRATISRVFAVSGVISVTMFVAAGKVESRHALVALACIPVVFAMQVAGWFVSRHVHGERFRVLVLSLLVGSGASAVIAALAG